MGVKDFLSLVRFVCRDAIIPSIEPATGALSDDYSALKPSLERLDAMVIEVMHRLHHIASDCSPDDTLSLFFQRLVHSIMSEACAPQRVSTIVLLFDSGIHPMKNAEHRKRAGTPKAAENGAPDAYKDLPPPPSFAKKWLDDREARRTMLGAFGIWLSENLSVRRGLNVVVHGLWAEPVVFWCDDQDRRRMSSPVERNLAAPDTRWPTTCYEADDLVMLWVKLLLYPCDGGPAHNLMVVSNDSDILLDMLIHTAIIMSLPESKQPRSREDEDQGIVCLFQDDCVAGGLPGASGRRVSVYAQEYVNVLAAADIFSSTFAPVLLHMAPAGEHFKATPLIALACLWLCHHHDYMPSTWVQFSANVHVWFPIAVQTLVAGDVGSMLEVQFSGEPGPWTPVEARVSGVGLRDMFCAMERRFAQQAVQQKLDKKRLELDVLNASNSGTSIKNCEMRIQTLEKELSNSPALRNAAPFHAQAARLALWLAKRLNNHLPGWRNGKGLPSEVEQEDGVSRWGYELHQEKAVPNPTAQMIGFKARKDPTPICLAAEVVAQRAFYFVSNS